MNVPRARRIARMPVASTSLYAISVEIKAKPTDYREDSTKCARPPPLPRRETSRLLEDARGYDDESGFSSGFLGLVSSVSAGIPGRGGGARPSPSTGM